MAPSHSKTSATDVATVRLRLDAKTLAQLPMLVMMLYFASGLELYLNFAMGILPLFGQLAGFGLLLMWIASWAMITNGASLALPRTVVVLLSMMAAFGMISALSFLYSPQSEPVVDALVGRTKMVFFIALFSIVLLDTDFRAKFAYAMAVAAGLGAALTIFDFITPTFSSVPGRGASLYLNSNETAILLTAFALIASTRLRPASNYLLWILVTAGVLVTFSRSGWGLLMLSLAGLTAIGKFGGGYGRFVLLGLVGTILAVILTTYLSGDLYVFVSRSGLGEYLDPNTLARLGSRGAAIDDYSSLEREEVFQFGIQKFLESPFIGWGVGYGYVWAEAVNTHNMPLSLAVELGLVGPLLYFAFFAMLIVRTRGTARLLSAVLLIAGQTTHNQFEFLGDALAIAFAIAATTETPGKRLSSRRPRARERPPRSLPA